MGIVVVTAVVLVAVVGATLFAAGDRTDSWARLGDWLRLAAAAFTGVLALVLVGPAWADSGGFALLLVGVPLVLAAGSLLVKGSSRLSSAVVGVAALLMLGWALLTGLGFGGFFVGPALLLVASATASTLGRQSRAPQVDARVSSRAHHG